ncbi:DUF4383 domain-containing protein [Nocardioides ginsengisoli]|uniref:DUF4383 domain-containing protein n=1 Tax=Nocardioides ginsengisoli TaxID=363868 RepID=A0ABW3VUA8_9ACTN
MDTTHSPWGLATPIQKVAALVAAVFVVVGVLGFIPGITTHYGSMTFAGHGSGARLLGVFDVSVLHNLVHLALGAVGLYCARTWPGARAYLIVGGVLYLVLTVYGLIVDRHDPANFVPVNAADNWLHLVLGVAMVALGVGLGRRSPFRHRADHDEGSRGEGPFRDGALGPG